MKLHQRIELLCDSERTWRSSLGRQASQSREHPVYTEERRTNASRRYIYIYILYVYMYFWTPTRFGVGEMAWTNEAATRQVLSILSDTRSRQPTSKPVGVSRLHYALALFRVASNKSTSAPVSPAPLIHPGQFYCEQGKFAGVIYRRISGTGVRTKVPRRFALRRLGDIMNVASRRNSFPFSFLLFFLDVMESPVRNCRFVETVARRRRLRASYLLSGAKR